MSDNYNAATAQRVYLPSRSVRGPYYIHASEALLHDLAVIGFGSFFEGPGDNPTGLAGYASSKLWLRQSAGVQETRGTVRSWNGGDASLLASWPEMDTAAWRRYLTTNYILPKPDDFAGATDAVKVQACIDYAIAQKIPMGLDARTYALDASLTATGDITILGVPGAVLDFTTRSGYANGASDGLIKIAGSAGATYTLQANTRRRLSDDIDLTGTRSGTTITFTSSIPHGLAVDDPVWVFGSATTTAAAQRVFYTQSAASSATRTTPFIVTGTPTTTTFTVTCENTGDTTLSGAAYLQYASDVIQLSSLTGLAVGQTVKIISDGERTDGVDEYIKIGEHGVIARLLPSISSVVLHSGVRDTYLMSDNARLQIVTLVRPVLRDFAIKGKGANTGSGYGDRGIWLSYTRAAELRGITIRSVDQMGLLLTDSVGFRVAGCDIEFDASDEAGASSGSLDIQYGIGLGTGAESGVVADNSVVGGRHAIVQTASATSGFHGLARDISVTGNTLRGSWLGAISTHMSAERWVISGNKIHDAQTGIDFRNCEEVLITENIIDAFMYAISLGSIVRDITISNNILRGSRSGIIRGPEAGNTDITGPVRIVGNDIDGGRPIFFIETAVTSEPVLIIDGNALRGTSAAQSGIRVSIGSDGAGGWTGSVSRNHILKNQEAGAGGNGMWLNQPRNVRAEGNTIDGAAAWSRCIYIDGARALNVIERGSHATVAPSVGIVTAAAGSGHYIESVPEESLTIASGAITVRPSTKTVRLTSEGGSGADNLDTINGMATGQSLVLTSLNSSQVVTIRDQAVSSGNLQLDGSTALTLDSARDTLTIHKTSTELLELGRTNG